MIPHTQKNLSGLGECGCCADDWDDRERFLFCFALWGGDAIKSKPTQRFLKRTWTFTNHLVKLWWNPETDQEELWPGTNTWDWVKESIWTCNKWTKTWTEPTPTLKSGAYPVGEWYSDANYENELIHDGFAPYFASAPQTNYLITTNWKMRHNTGGGTDPYYYQTVKLQAEYSTDAAYIYEQSEFLSNWLAIYAKLDFDTITSRKEGSVNDNFHFGTYHYNADGHIVERYWYEDLMLVGGVLQDSWKDKWEVSGDDWVHTVDSFETYFSEIVNGGPESEFFAGPNTSYLTDEDYNVFSHVSMMALPHSTYAYLPPRYWARRYPEYDPEENIIGIPDILILTTIPGMELFGCHDSAFARITLVPIPSGTTTMCDNRFVFDPANTDERDNPLQTKTNITNTGDLAIKVKNDEFIFEFIRMAAC